jgi:UDP-N-acetylglucosamine--N-acetylmuramyl-(pentapeptide) pyrophosphoryl-undecaprenol N-acetylglucosamine transferase
MKILFTGGGTLGPVTPLLAVAQAWRAQDDSVEFVWVGTGHGPERKLVEDAGIEFCRLPVARLTRYPSFEWLTLPFKFAWAFFKAIQIMRSQKPHLVASAGGYTAVPMIIAARLFGVSVWVHQQDVEPILTNRLTAPFASIVTVAWKENLKRFKRAELVGNPVRKSVLNGDHAAAVSHFNLNKDKPTVLVVGGGSGAKWINETLSEISTKLAEKANVIHLTGRGKMLPSLYDAHEDYYAVEFLTDGMADALAAADVVVSRAGLGMITELSALKKPTIFIPLPHSPQESNARAIEKASVVMHEGETSADQLYDSIVKLLNDQKERARLGNRLGEVLDTDVASKIMTQLKNLIPNP